MAGITEKSNSGLFENEVEFKGKYATYVRFLKDDIGLFPTFREAYTTAAVIGYLNNCDETADDSEKVQAASIFPNELIKRKADLRFLYRVIMLTKDEPGFSIEDYMNRTFRDDSDEESTDKLKNNMAIFNRYACGGLEFLYDKFKDLDKTEDVVNTLYEYIHDYIVGIGLLEDDELPDFSPEFN